MEKLRTYNAAIHAWQQEGGVGAPSRESASGTPRERADRAFQQYRRANLGLPERVSADARNALVRAIDERRACFIQSNGCRYIVEGRPEQATQAYVTMEASGAAACIKSIYGPFPI